MLILINIASKSLEYLYSTLQILYTSYSVANLHFPRAYVEHIVVLPLVVPLVGAFILLLLFVVWMEDLLVYIVVDTAMFVVVAVAVIVVLTAESDTE